MYKDDDRVPTSNGDRLLNGVNISALSFIHLDFTRLVTGDEASRFNNGSDIDGSDCAARQERSEQKVVARRNNDLHESMVLISCKTFCS
jgi:hypothetical protein